MKALWAILLLLSIAGCESPFPPQTRVERLRILGVRADPPEIDPFGIVGLSALVADPGGQGRELQYRWGVCLLVFGSEAMDIECPGPDSYSLPGEGPQTSLDMSELLAWLAEQGFDLGQMDELPHDLQPGDIPLYVGLEVSSGEENTRAVKRITVRLEQEEEPNLNPVLVGLDLDGQPLGEQPVPIGAGQKVTLTPVADEATRQVYQRESEEAGRLEDFLFAWYSTVGDLENRRTILEVDSRGNRLDENEWKLPKKTGAATLWLVVRDGRFGTDWLEYQFEIVP